MRFPQRYVRLSMPGGGVRILLESSYTKLCVNFNLFAKCLEQAEFLDEMKHPELLVTLYHHNQWWSKLFNTKGTRRPRIQGAMAVSEATVEVPVYRKVLYKQPPEHATPLWLITCDEGWRQSIVCTDMYEWAADWLLSVIQGKPFAPETRPDRKEANK